MSFFQRLQNSAFTDWFLGSPSIWAYPTVLTLHTVGMAILVGASFVINLRVLQVSDNYLAELPGELCALTGLTMLSASGNLLRALPAEIGALTSLTELTFIDNRLRALPDSLATRSAAFVVLTSSTNSTPGILAASHERH